MNDLPKYARLEIERRWLVDATAMGELANVPYRLIEDLYVGESRLRLRKITDPSGNALFKFGKKYGKHSPLSEPITNALFDRGRVPAAGVLGRDLCGEAPLCHRRRLARCVPTTSFAD